MHDQMPDLQTQKAMLEQRMQAFRSIAFDNSLELAALRAQNEEAAPGKKIGIDMGQGRIWQGKFSEAVKMYEEKVASAKKAAAEMERLLNELPEAEKEEDGELD